MRVHHSEDAASQLGSMSAAFCRAGRIMAASRSRISENQATKRTRFEHDPEFSLLMTITHHVHFDVGAENANMYVHRLI